MKKILISPSILNADFSNLQKECANLVECGADWIHLDVMDGKFVPNSTFDHNVVKQLCGKIDAVLDVHLMIENPELYVEDYVDAGADVVTFHIEATQHVEKTINLIKSRGKKVGISIKPNTDVETLLPYKNLIDMVLVMSVEPGFGGQKFIPTSVEKIKKVRNLLGDVIIQVDGGINPQTAQFVIDAGVDVIVAGSAIINAEDRSLAIKQIRGSN